jgi:hypothetical protein
MLPSMRTPIMKAQESISAWLQPGERIRMVERCIPPSGDPTSNRQVTLQPLAGLSRLTRHQVAAAATELSISISQCYRLIRQLRLDPTGHALQPRKRGRPLSVGSVARETRRMPSANPMPHGTGSGEREQELIALIYEGCLESKPWSSFLRALRLHVDCDTADISLIPGRPAIPPISIWDTRLSMSRRPKVSRRSSSISTR